VSRPDTHDLVPLADRIASTTVLRLVVVVLPLVLARALPDLLTVSTQSLAGVAAAYLAVALVLGRLRGTSRQVAVSVLLLPLLADGVYLGWVLHGFGGLSGPAPYLVGLHVVGVTLLASFRSGLELAFWHSLVGLIVLEAESVGVIAGSLPAFPTSSYTWYLLLLWAAALATASFAAVNERELRRRRYDADALQRFAAAAERIDDPPRLLGLLAVLGVDELLAERAVAVLLPPPGAARGTAVLHVRGGTTHTAPVPPGAMADRSLVQRALAERGPVLTSALRRDTDPWLSALLPGAQRLLAVPLGAQEDVAAVLVLECRRSPLRRGPARVERRLIATAVQAASHAGQALSRALLIAQLRDAALRDGLTGVANRRQLDLALEAAAVRWRTLGETCTLLLLDLDHFKLLNDTHGHQAGDTVLRDVAQAVQHALPGDALLARYGGEELAVLLPGRTLQEGLPVAEQVRLAVAATVSAAPVTASVGVAELSGQTAGELLSSADASLYAAKAAGRNCVRAGSAPLVPAQRRAEQQQPVG
jgi:two-component system cell cycle response regulator